MLKLVTPLQEGHKLFEYRVLRPLGQGGFGTTYLCRDEHLQKQCVVKEFTPHVLVARRPSGDLKALRWGWRGAFARRASSKLPDLVELVLSRPIVSARLIQDRLNVSKQGALNLIGELGLREMTGRGRFRAWGIV